MVCRKGVVVKRGCYCVIYAWHTHVDDVRCATKQWIGTVALPSPWRCVDEAKQGSTAVEVDPPQPYGV